MSIGALSGSAGRLVGQAEEVVDPRHRERQLEVIARMHEEPRVPGLGTFGDPQGVMAVPRVVGRRRVDIFLDHPADSGARLDEGCYWPSRVGCVSRILHLRTDHVDGEVILVDGVDPDHTPGQHAERLRDLFAAAAIGGRRAE